MLFRTLDRLKRSTLMTAIMLAFLGSTLLLVPDGYVSFLGSATAFVLAVVCVYVVLRFISSKKVLINYFRLFFGMLAGLTGLILFLYPNALVRILNLIVGILPMMLGTLGNYNAFVYARRSGRKGWGILVVLSAALFIFGGFSLFQPWMYSVSGTMKVVGGTMLFSSLVFVLMLIWIWPVNAD